MPEPRRDVRPAAERALLFGSGISAAAAVAALLRSEEVVVAGESFRTHTDAVWVLGTLAVVLLVAAFVFHQERER